MLIILCMHLTFMWNLGDMLRNLFHMDSLKEGTRYKVGEPNLLARFTMGQYHSLVKKGPSNSSVSEYNP